MTLAPTIMTERLTLRAHRRDDFDGYDALMCSPDAKFMGGPYTRKQAWAIFANDNLGWILDGFGSWAVDWNGRFIGQVSLQWPERYPEPEFGWMMLPEVRGQGFAVEAASAAKDWIFANTKRTTLVSFIDPENAASIRVAEKLGGTPDPEAWREDADDLVYRHVKAA